MTRDLLDALEEAGIPPERTRPARQTVAPNAEGRLARISQCAFSRRTEKIWFAPGVASPSASRDDGLHE